MKRILKIAAGLAVLYCILHWATNNPNSASNVKTTVDEFASMCVDKFNTLVDALTDDKEG